jgi:hypothetical protein
MGFKSGTYSEAYARDEPNLAKQFAADLTSAHETASDLVIVPALESRRFQPYVDALLEADGSLSVLGGAFSKPAGFRADDNGRTYDDALDATVFNAGKLPARHEAVLLESELLRYICGRTSRYLRALLDYSARSLWLPLTML